MVIWKNMIFERVIWSASYLKCLCNAWSSKELERKTAGTDLIAT